MLLAAGWINWTSGKILLETELRKKNCWPVSEFWNPVLSPWSRGITKTLQMTVRLSMPSTDAIALQDETFILVFLTHSEESGEVELVVNFTKETLQFWNHRDYIRSIDYKTKTLVTNCLNITNSERVHLQSFPEEHEAQKWKTPAYIFPGRSEDNVITQLIDIAHLMNTSEEFKSDFLYNFSCIIRTKDNQLSANNTRTTSDIISCNFQNRVSAPEL